MDSADITELLAYFILQERENPGPKAAEESSGDFDAKSRALFGRPS